MRSFAMAALTTYARPAPNDAFLMLRRPSAAIGGIADGVRRSTADTLKRD